MRAVRYGFVIDQTKCIGCHACTVACKEEHDVPLGVFRTWVKYVERGTFPETRRFFSVLRCNHCDNAPCVTICPTTALFRRTDGIVDFDRDRCIGCKSCMQACPYDALYIDPHTHTAAKCNYCAHRVEAGLEPACVIVCPERAIVAGDLDDATSAIAGIVATAQVQVRKAEQRTQPKLFYVGADAAAITPSMQEPAERFVWAERTAEDASLARLLAVAAGDGAARAGTADAAAHARGAGAAMSRPVYDVSHAAFPWGWKVSAYLWTKSVAAGTLLVAALGVLFGASVAGPVTSVFAPLVALLFLAATTALLVFDLKRPERFLFVITKPNFRSWLVLGAWILMAYGAVSTLWFVAGASGAHDWFPAMSPIVALLAAGSAGYSAFLFGQAEGRDFWQSPMTLPHLLVAAIVAGAAVLVVLHGLAGRAPARGGFFETVLAAGLALEGLVLAAEYLGAHSHADAARASRLVTHGPWRAHFWGGVVIAGIAAPLALVIAAPAAAPAAAVLALAGLWIYEHVWIKAGQAVPLS